jgi:hypothetical protein
VEDVHVIPNYSYQVRRFCGKGFICIGDAHRFLIRSFLWGDSQHAGGPVRRSAH